MTFFGGSAVEPRRHAQDTPAIIKQSPLIGTSEDGHVCVCVPNGEGGGLVGRKTRRRNMAVGLYSLHAIFYFLFIFIFLDFLMRLMMGGFRTLSFAYTCPYVGFKSLALFCLFFFFKHFFFTEHALKSLNVAQGNVEQIPNNEAPAQKNPAAAVPASYIMVHPKGFLLCGFV